jgi:hypothetical protein
MTLALSLTTFTVAFALGRLSPVTLAVSFQSLEQFLFPTGRCRLVISFPEPHRPVPALRERKDLQGTRGSPRASMNRVQTTRILECRTGHHVIAGTVRTV